MNWEALTAKVEETLTNASPPGLFGSMGVDPALAARVSTLIIRDEVEAYIASIPRVPTNKNDVIVNCAGMAVVGLVLFGVYKIIRAEVENDK